MTPHSILFFPNGMAAVTDAAGHQLGHYQGKQEHAIQTLAAAGYNWKHLPVIVGSPDDHSLWIYTDSTGAKTAVPEPSKKFRDCRT